MNMYRRIGIGFSMICLLTAAVATHAQDVVATNQSVMSTTVQAGRDTVTGMGEAAVETAGAVKSGGTHVVQEGQLIWKDAVVPAFQRMLAAIPSLFKALLLLLAFWILARISGATVRKLLSLTKVDDRAARDWGFERALAGSNGHRRSIALLGGGLVKWIILLFGFVAFFNALNLELVAGPLQHALDRIVGAVPSLLKAAVILFVYWAVAAIVRVGLTKGLNTLSFSERVKKYWPPREVNGQAVGAGAMLGRLAFYVILLVGIPPFLEALGQQSLVAPLQEMLAKVLNFIPNVIAAILIFFIGKLVATIVREVAVNFLSAAGADTGTEKLGVAKLLGEKKISQISGFIVYLFIMIPIVISAIDSLQIKAVSEPMTDMLGRILAVVPSILVAAVILIVGYALARFLKNLVQNFLGGIGFDRLPEKTGLPFLKPGEGHATLSSIGGTVVMLIVLLLTLQQALATLGLVSLAAFVAWTIAYLPNLAVGLLILLAALSLGRFAERFVSSASKDSGSGALVGGVAKYAVIFMGTGMALTQFGVSREIVVSAVSMAFGAAALALGLAFGLGGKDRAKEFIDQLGKKE
ncbi:MAG: mechanosensitive ion channel [Kiritimatiellales bacterium]